MTTATITPQSAPVGGQLVTFTQAVRDRTPLIDVTGGADDIVAFEVTNSTSVPVFLKIFDTVVAVTPGSTTPDWVFRVAANSSLTYACPDLLVITNGVSLFISLDGGTGVVATLGPSSAVVAQVLVS
tara:strand:- start:242 stop:622 length:381 start_codon:yes stop_codon:yes gene_type:complete